MQSELVSPKYILKLTPRKNTFLEVCLVQHSLKYVTDLKCETSEMCFPFFFLMKMVNNSCNKYDDCSSYPPSSSK